MRYIVTGWLCVLLLLITLFAPSCRQSQPVYTNDIHQDSLMKKFLSAYNKYPFINHTPEDSITKAFLPVLQTQPPIIKAAYYMVMCAYKRSDMQPDSAIFYGKKGLSEGYKDSTHAYMVFCPLLQRLTLIYTERHQNDSAIKYGYAALEQCKKFHYQENSAYSQLVELYYNLGDTSNFKKIIFTSLTDTTHQYKAATYNNLYVYYSLRQMPDSQLYYLKKAEAGFKEQSNRLQLGVCYVNIAQYYKTAVHNFDSAKHYITMAIALNKEFNNEASEDYAILGAVHEHDKNWKPAETAYITSLKMAVRDSSETDMVAAYQNLAKFYAATHEYPKSVQVYDSGYNSLKWLKNNTLVNKLKGLEEDYRIKGKQLEIDRLNGVDSANKRTLSLQRYLIFAFVLLLVLGLAMVYQANRRQRLVAKNLKLEAENEKIQLEQRLLRTQMEPHFIFNTLSVMQGLIRSNENEKAGKYLNQFAKLLRSSLENSRESLVPLNEEIESLENYLSLQSMRFEGAFKYTISVYEGFEEDGLLIPPMLLQPFVENAVLHGMRGLLYEGLIQIKIDKGNGALHCTITDNGHGRQPVLPGERSSHGSLSTTITQERLALLSWHAGMPGNIKITDLPKPESGTVVELTIPF